MAHTSTSSICVQARCSRPSALPRSLSSSELAYVYGECCPIVWRSIGARAAAMGIGIVSAVTEMRPGDAPPRRARAARARRGASSPFLFGCLLIDRVAAVRSVDFAAEEGVVAPPGGAPGTPAGYCWLLDVSLRRVARSGWTCGVGD